MTQDPCIQTPTGHKASRRLQGIQLVLGMFLLAIGLSMSHRTNDAIVKERHGTRKYWSQIILQSKKCFYPGTLIFDILIFDHLDASFKKLPK